MISGIQSRTTKPPPRAMINPLHPLSRGLVGYWLFNEGAGSRANDISGHGNHGTLKNMSPNTGWGGSKFGGGLQFDGVDDYVIKTSMSPDFDEKSEISVSVWFKPNSLDTGGASKYLISLPEVSSGWNGIDIIQQNAIIGFDLATHSDDSLGMISTTLTDTDWHHITLTYDGITLKAYLDGASVGNDPVTLGTGLKHASKQLNVGRFGSFGSHCAGAIDNVRIYNRALTALEIKTLYHNPFCNLLHVPIHYVPAAAGLPIPVAMYNYRRRRV